MINNFFSDMNCILRYYRPDLLSAVNYAFLQATEIYSKHVCDFQALQNDTFACIWERA